MDLDKNYKVFIIALQVKYIEFKNPKSLFLLLDLCKFNFFVFFLLPCILISDCVFSDNSFKTW